MLTSSVILKTILVDKNKIKAHTKKPRNSWPPTTMLQWGTKTYEQDKRQVGKHKEKKMQGIDNNYIGNIGKNPAKFQH